MSQNLHRLKVSQSPTFLSLSLWMRSEVRKSENDLVQMERKWQRRIKNEAVKKKADDERYQSEQMEMEILRAACSAVLTLLLAIRVQASPPSLSFSPLFPLTASLLAVSLHLALQSSH